MLHLDERNSEKYVAEKIKNWANDVSELSEIAKEEPQLAFSAFNVGISQRWKFVQRTIKNIAHLFEPLEQVIRDKFIPAICAKKSQIPKEGSLHYHIG